MVEKDKELKKCKEIGVEEACENEKKGREVEKMKHVLERKDEELNNMKIAMVRKDVEIEQMKQKNTNAEGSKKQEEEIVKLKQRLEETRDLCLEYKHKIENAKKETKENVDKINIKKLKLEEELRSAIMEKNLHRESERILLHTFDTLKMHYDAKKKGSSDSSNTRKENNDKKTESANGEKELNCDTCNYKTTREANLRAHINNVHKDGDDLFEDGNVRNENLEFCDECDYRTPFIINLNIHKSEVHGEWEEVRRRTNQSGRQNFVDDQTRLDNGFCLYWNRGRCDYAEKCKYLHEEAPECFYGNRCNKKSYCKSFHEDLYRTEESSFLDGRTNRNYRTQ